MKPLNMNELTRRAFLLRSAATLGVVSPLIKVFPATSLRALQGRPALSEASLGGYIQTVRAQGPLAVSDLVKEVRSDVRGFLRRRFALNPAQDAFVSRLTPTDIAGIGTAFERGLAGRNELRIQIPDTGPVPGKMVGYGCDMTFNRADRGRVAGVAVETWSVVVVRP